MPCFLGGPWFLNHPSRKGNEREMIMPVDAHPWKHLKTNVERFEDQMVIEKPPPASTLSPPE